MNVPDYRVKTIESGNLRNALEVSFDHQLFSITVLKNKEYSHPVFDRLINKILKDVTDSTAERNKMNKTSWTVKRREQKLVIKKLDFRSRFVNLYGDIEQAKDDWDYNRAPAHSNTNGKFGDLRSFLTMRKGSELDLGDIK